MAYAKWETSFNRQIDSLLDYADKIQEQAAFDMMEEGIRPRTPYGMPETWKSPPKAGYEPGQARAGWQMEVDGKLIRIFNDVAYIGELETGWSRQAPIGMFRVSLLEWPQWVAKAQRKIRFR